MKTYDAILLLAGENPQTHPRSKKAIELYRKGIAGSIYVTGGFGGFGSDKVPTDGAAMKEYLESQDIKDLFLDEQSNDTIGNFTFPLITPTTGNPSLKDLSILVVTEEHHMKRARDYASKIFDKMPDAQACPVATKVMASSNRSIMWQSCIGSGR